MKQVIMKMVVMLLTGTFSAAVMAGLNEGVAAYKKNNYKAALIELEPLAKAGNSNAQLIVSFIYDEGGQGINKDKAKALEMLSKSAEQGNDDAQASLAAKYAEGDGVVKDEKKAASLYLQSAMKGNEGAQTNLGTMYAMGRGVARDDSKAEMWWQKAAAQGSKLAQSNLCILKPGRPGCKK